MSIEFVAKELVNILIEKHVKSEQDPLGMGIEHARWMLEGISGGYIQYEKAHRWLGYAQAIIVQESILSLDAIKLLNKKYL